MVVKVKDQREIKNIFNYFWKNLWDTHDQNLNYAEENRQIFSELQNIISKKEEPCHDNTEVAWKGILNIENY